MKQAQFPAIHQRFSQLIGGLSKDLFEKDQAIRLALLSSVAGESIFLLGPPGVAKSMLARRLKYAYADSRSFEYLMGKFSTPDEVFGPVSISKLKNEDKYERLTDKYLPGANIVFLDEIWKSSPPIQNSLLTVLNEKIYRNGEQELKVNIRGLISASNELPLEGEGLEALWDRFLIRLVIRGIQDERAFNEMITLPSTGNEDDPIADQLKISDAEYHQWTASINEIKVPDHILGLINHLRRSIRERNASLDPAQSMYISDRRWRKMVQLVRASAFLNGRTSVNVMDCFLFGDCIWSTIDQRDESQALVLGSIVAYGYRKLVDAQPLREELQTLRKEISLETQETRMEMISSPKVYQDNLGVTYYKLEKFWGTDPSYIKVEDFQRLGEEELFVPVFEKHAKNFRAFQNYGLKGGDDFSLLQKNKKVQVEKEEAEQEVSSPKVPDEAALKIWNRQIDKMMQMVGLFLEELERQKAEEFPMLDHHLFVEKNHAPYIQESLTNAVNEILSLKLEIEKARHSYESIGAN